MRAILAFLIFSLVYASAQAQSVVDSPEADETFLTIYPDNLAMVTEIRRVNVPAGRSTLRFLGVSDQMIARTAVLQSFEGVSLESNFDTDLITKGALLNKAMGETIQILRVNPGDGEETLVTGKLLAALKKNAAVYGVVLETDDGLEGLECAGLPESIIFSNLPRDLHDKPVLSMVVKADEAGEKEIGLTYLSSGISWAADYRLDVIEEEGEGPLFGWLTITNSTAKSFKDVPTNIIAGQISRVYRTRPDPVSTTQYLPSCWPRGSTKTGTPNAWIEYKEIPLSAKRSRGGGEAMPLVRMEMAQAPVASYGYSADSAANVATVEDFADYKLYRTPRPITVAAQQTKQIAFLDTLDAEYKRIYKFDFGPYQLASSVPQSLRVEYEIDNSRDGNLGIPLPEGTMRVMTQRASGKTAFLGESSVRDLAVDLPVEIPVSESIGVVLSPGYEVMEKDGGHIIRMQARIMNATHETINAEIKINSQYIRYPDIAAASHNPREGKTLPTYSLKVAAETAEEFYIDIPIEQGVKFEHFPRNYGKADSYSKLTTGKVVNLPGQAGNLAEIANLMSGKGKFGVNVKAQLNAKENAEKDGQNEIRLDESFTFTNSLPRPQKLIFTYHQEQVFEVVVVQEASIERTGNQERMIPTVTKTVGRNVVELVSSNIDPDNEDQMVWTLIVPANGSISLDVVSQGQHRLN